MRALAYDPVRREKALYEGENGESRWSVAKEGKGRMRR